MSTTMNVEVVCSEAVRPSTPTPPHLKNFSLSLCDQLNPALYVPIILYYPDQDPSTKITSADKIRRLKSSLSVLFTRFYPYAGRIKGNLSIDCNDEGTIFHEAKVDREMSDVLARPDLRELRMLLPREMELEEAFRVYPLLVQANLFECGGLALGICISHKIADGATLSNFIASWANIAIDPEKFTEHPRLDSSTFFPPSSHLLDLLAVDFPKDRRVTQRYVFDTEKIAALLEMAKSEQVVQPTRVDAVSALLWHCMTRASGRRFGTTGMRSVIAQAVDLRARMSPSISKGTAGNLATLFVAEMDGDVKGEAGGFFRKLTAKLRAEKDEFLENIVKKKMVGETASATLLENFETLGGLMNNQEVDLYICSSWRRLSMYQADFGWGKPIWMSLDNMADKNTIILVDGRGGDGIEAWLTLQEDHVARLDRDEELLRFASVNPSISW